MAQRHHGLTYNEVNDGLPMIPDSASNVVGMVVTASDADASVFPLDTPVLFTDPTTVLGKAGDQGTLAKSLESMLYQTRTPTIIVRVPEGTSEAETTANIIGSVDANGRYKGMKALLTAKSICGAKPKILGVPNLDNEQVTTAMVSVAQALRGFVYAETHAATKEEAIAYRGGFGQRELMLIHGDFLNGTDTVSSVAIALGLRAKWDQDRRSFANSISNKRANGVTGITKPVSWDPQSPANTTDADFLNNNDITCLAREKGFFLWGNRTTSVEMEWAFETHTRTSQALQDTFSDIMLQFYDNTPSVGLFKDMVHMFDGKLQDLTREEKLVGGSAWFDPTPNNQANMSAGNFFFDFDYTPFSPMEHITLTQRKTQRYWVDFVNKVVAMVPSAPANI